MNNTELGQLGEAIAERHLKQKGYSILVKNYRFKKLEIDIIAELNQELVIVEVKTRQTAEIGEPWRAVTKQKQRQIIKASNQYIIENNIDWETRFDVVSIVHNSYRTAIEHIENAFYPCL